MVNLSKGSKEDPKVLQSWDDFQAAEFNPSPGELEFLQTSTGIQDAQELKRHLLTIQRKALEVFPYPCIKKWGFIMTNIAKVKGYKQCIQLPRERTNALLLDLGCGFGADARKAVLDGFPPKQVVAVDLHTEFWQLGRDLFRDNEETMPITFIAGDALDYSFMSLVSPSTPISSKPLNEITTLTQLHHRLSAIHASLFFHLFSKEQQEQLAALVAGLLLPERGSVIFGHQLGAEEEGIGKELGKWAFSPESWKAMWCNVLKSAGWTGRVEVDCELMPAPEEIKGLGLGTHFLFWTVQLA